MRSFWRYLTLSLTPSTRTSLRPATLLFQFAMEPSDASRNRTPPVIQRTVFGRLVG
jgi:hypothetical protein